jgi:hypothetical protein
MFQKMDLCQKKCVFSTLCAGLIKKSDLNCLVYTAFHGIVPSLMGWLKWAN